MADSGESHAPPTASGPAAPPGDEEGVVGLSEITESVSQQPATNPTVDETEEVTLDNVAEAEKAAGDAEMEGLIQEGLADIPDIGEDGTDVGEGFDPDTLANLAALSRIDGVTGEEIANYLQSHVESLESTPIPVQSGDETPLADDATAGEEEAEGEAKKKRKRMAKVEGGEDNEDVLREIKANQDEGEGEDEQDERGDGEFMDPRYVYEEGRLKRKRNRNVLSCTELTGFLNFPFPNLKSVTGENCDRNIPCSRCIKRGVPSMCRMEAPVFPERKKKRSVKDIPIDHELGLRVQALESLIRSGSSLDPDSASAAAMETILHATRAANSGSHDASTALAQLTESAMSGGGISGMSLDAQSSLLMEVLQQLSTASQGRTLGDAPPSDPNDIWSSLPTSRPDPFSRTAAAYNADASSSKLDLSLPGFREDSGKPFVPPTVRYVEKQMHNSDMLARDALPAWGDDKFLSRGVSFAYGADHVRLKDDNVAKIQTSTLTGALRLAGTFLSRFPAPPGRSIYIPSPATEEDTATLRDSGLDIRHYRYLDRKTGSVDFDGLSSDLQAAQPRSAVLLHVSGSIPTGVDLTESQWRMITSILQERSLIPLVVMAFQGLATGDPAKDAQPLRYMAHEALPVVLCQNFDAMMGLYTDSPSIVSVVTQSAETRSKVDSQLRAVGRALHAHPSPWGAQVAHTILSDQKLHPAWLTEIKAMSDRLRSVREKLYDLLANKFKTPGNWIHIKRSVGMYCTTLLSPVVNEVLTTKRHIYLLPHGSFSVGCLNSSRIETLARSIDSAVLSSIHEAEEAQAQQLAMEFALAAAREAAAREEAEEAAAAAREEDRMLMERSIASAIEAQRQAEEEERDREEEERRREEEDRELDQAVRKAAERAQIARQAEAILASIGGAM